VFVPLCGGEADLAFLFERGADVVGVDRYGEAFGPLERLLPPDARKEAAGGEGPFMLRWLREDDGGGGGGGSDEGGSLTLLAADLFAGPPPALSPTSGLHFDAVLDKGSLTAIHPDQMAQYARALARWAGPARSRLPRLLLVALEKDPLEAFESDATCRQAEGPLPPYAVAGEAEVLSVFAPAGWRRLTRLSPLGGEPDRPAPSSAAGKKCLVQVVYLLEAAGGGEREG
jgi:hypothetical protein